MISSWEGLLSSSLVASLNVRWKLSRVSSSGLACGLSLSYFLPAASRSKYLRLIFEISLWYHSVWLLLLSYSWKGLKETLLSTDTSRLNVFSSPFLPLSTVPIEVRDIS